MGTQLTPRQTLIALMIGMIVLLAAFYIPMAVLGGQQDLLEWLLPAICIIGVFLFLPVGAALYSIYGQLVALPFIGIFMLVTKIKQIKTKTNKESVQQGDPD